jgi:hemerythrin-like domain-containing protein
MKHTSSPPVNLSPHTRLLVRIHKGLRYSLCKLLVQLGHVLPEDRTACSQLIDDLDGALYFAERHLERSERYLYPALDGLVSEVFAQVCARKHGLVNAVHELRRSAFALEARPPLQDAELDALYLTLSHFLGELLLHLHCDETVVIPKLSEAYSSEVMNSVADAMRQSMGPDEHALFERTLGPASRP